MFVFLRRLWLAGSALLLFKCVQINQPGARSDDISADKSPETQIPLNQSDRWPCFDATWNTLRRSAAQYVEYRKWKSHTCNFTPLIRNKKRSSDHSKASQLSAPWLPAHSPLSHGETQSVFTPFISHVRPLPRTPAPSLSRSLAHSLAQSVTFQID